jgi:hypothetical protein
MSDDIASEMIAKYAVMGPRVELERTLPVKAGENVIAGVIAHTRYGDSPLGGGRRGFLRLSTRRLCIVRHYGFIRDRILVIPPKAIADVEGEGPAKSIRITFRTEDGDRTLTIVTWRQPAAADGDVLDSRNLDEQFRRLARALGSTAITRG